VGNLFLNVAIGVANEKWNSPHHVKTKRLGCSFKIEKYYNTLFEQAFFQNMYILIAQLQLTLDANNETN
jgi:hypothetical protein